MLLFVVLAAIRRALGYPDAWTLRDDVSKILAEYRKADSAKGKQS